MKSVLEYKGYHAKVEYDAEGASLIGKIDGISDLVTFEAVDALDIVQEFHNAVDDYLDFCAEIGKDPEKEYKGQFNVRIPSALHRSLSMIAYREGISLNAVAEDAFEEYVRNKTTDKPDVEMYTEATAHMPLDMAKAFQNNGLSSATYDYNKELIYDQIR